ncbi:2-oxo acid dehydrogenase subunit E2 [Candidatus Woesearchaeota archaeon]|nr:2-oxo acid dehydrogenase subunit E2 [Candidatus Woesearchaeota archaeon]
MPYEFKFPDVGEGITEGEIVKWLIKEGDKVKQDQVIGEIETDKAIVQIPSPKAGTILKIHIKEGEIVKVGETLVTIGESGEKVEVKKEEKSKSVGVMGVLEEAKEELEIPIKKESKIEKVEGILATPGVRSLAKSLNVNLLNVKGSGPNSRITKEDVENATKETKQEVTKSEVSGIKVTKKYDMFGYVDRIQLKGIRKATAKLMDESHIKAAHVMHSDLIDITHLYEIREKENIKLTYLPFVIKALIVALKEHPYLNSSLDEINNEIILKKYYNIGIAVDTEDGLLVPVLKVADSKKILDLGKEIEELANKARNRTIDLMDLRGGTFTITNVGSIIINYPEAAILGLGRIYDSPLAINGKVEIRKVLPISISFDHRILDGAEAARFANKIKELLEDPDEFIID